MLSTKDVVLTQRSQTASYLDIQSGGQEFDSRVELVRATVPIRLLTGGDLFLSLTVSCRCKPFKNLHRTCRDNTGQHLARESDIALTLKSPARWEAFP